MDITELATLDFARSTDQLNPNIIRISTLFLYSDGAYVDVYYKYNRLLSDCSNILLQFSNYEKIDKFLISPDMVDFLEFYKINRQGSEFCKEINNSLSIEDIFRFGEFCSILSWFLLKEKCHII